MTKVRHEDPDIADEYDLTNAVRGEHAGRMKNGFTVRIVSDEEDQRRQARLIEKTDADRGQVEDEHR